MIFLASKRGRSQRCSAFGRLRKASMPMARRAFKARLYTGASVKPQIPWGKWKNFKNKCGKNGAPSSWNTSQKFPDLGCQTKLILKVSFHFGRFSTLLHKSTEEEKEEERQQQQQQQPRRQRRGRGGGGRRQ